MLNLLKYQKVNRRTKKPDIHYVYSVDVETDNEEYYAKKIKTHKL